MNCIRCKDKGWLAGVGAMPHAQPCTNCGKWKVMPRSEQTK